MDEVIFPQDQLNGQVGSVWNSESPHPIQTLITKLSKRVLCKANLLNKPAPSHSVSGCMDVGIRTFLPGQGDKPRPSRSLAGGKPNEAMADNWDQRR